ncbi:hypothetical protein QRX50_23525 [Amycolatopsis carbonis]|uniref:DUF222 domain-containing protein n=1 Tax=Amycolatopsis carbonis TaxID=715471 RepID=A0A9Y2N201_9PSEU|nr:hypothetical protein [Amycolatopsis sp. 2-15]WIX83517.1 hypothetical protein QRX50_23525 [Amycolatopsis sp. 2-15]
MASVDDLVELVQRPAAAEKNAMAAKWKDEDDVRRLIGKARAASAEQRQEVRRDIDPARLSPEWARLWQNHVDADPPADHTEAVTHEDAAQAERDGVAAVAIARMALTDAARAVLEARLARIRAGEDEPDAVTVDGHVPLRGANPDRVRAQRPAGLARRGVRGVRAGVHAGGVFHPAVARRGQRALDRAAEPRRTPAEAA